MLAGCPALFAKSMHPDYQLLRGELQQYGDWIVGCDNNADFTMIGFPKHIPVEQCNHAIHEMAIQVSPSAIEGASPDIEMVPLGPVCESTQNDPVALPNYLNATYDVAGMAQPH